MLDRRRFVVGGLVIAVAVGWLIYQATMATAEYEMSFDDFFAARDIYAGQDIRVRGWVAAGTIRRAPETNQLDFALGRQDASVSLPVVYRGVPPDMFTEGREVMVEGRYANGAFTARQILTQCPSKYEAKKEGAGAPAS